MLSSSRRSSRPAPARCRPAPHRRPLSPAWWLAAASVPILAAAWAGVAQGASLTVQASVAGACTAQAGTLDFAQYVAGQTAAKDVNTTFTVTCPQGVNVQVKLSPGQNANGTERGMKRPGSNDVLRYNIYSDAGRTQIWGDGTFGQSKSITSFDPSNNSMQNVHGRVFAAQTISAGEYSDQVTITVELNQ